MRGLLAIFGLVVMSSPAFAMTNKECIARPGEFGGEVMNVQIRAEKIVVAQGSWLEGYYEANGRRGAFADGKAYVEYQGDVDGYHSLLKVGEDFISVHSEMEGEIDVDYDCTNKP